MNKQKLLELDKGKLHYLILELLVKEKISFLELSNLYTKYLEIQERKSRLNIAGLATMLSYFIPFNEKKKDSFIEAKSAYHLLKSGMFHTAKIEKDYEKIVEAYKYTEDEDGLPLTNK